MATEAGNVTVRQGEDGSGEYYDVAVTVDGVAGTVSIERDGQALAGSNDVSDWASSSLVALGSDVLDEVRAVAAQVLS